MTAKGTAFSILAATGATLALVSSAHAAKPGTLTCGETITADTTLAHDLVNCPDTGIVIGADDISLDLNGHTVDGDNTLVDPCRRNAFCDMGILNVGHDGVTIEGGTVRQFGTGAFVFRVAHNRVRGLDASRNTYNGLLIGQSRRSAATRNSASFNGLTTDYPGIAVFSSKRIRIERTSSTHNADLGLFVTESDHNRFLANNLSRNPEAGAIIEGDANRVARNRVSRTGDGLIVSGSENAITRNRIVKPVGCSPGCGVGISLESGRDNLIAANEIRMVAGQDHADGRGIGIRVSTFVHSQSVRGTVVRRNRITDASRYGILIGKTIKRTLLVGNRVSRTANDGIRVEASAARLARNHTVHNGDLGIAARPGADDGGGNVARHNADPRQCSHIACR